MSVVIYGRRAYGRVRQHEGEFVDTQFAHIDYLPLFPIGSYWVTSELGGGQRMGFPIKLHGKSVAAGYLRVWGPILAFASFALVTGLAGYVVPAVFAGLTAWSWTWRPLRGAAARRRSDFNRIAFGSRCEPAWMTTPYRNDVEARLGEAWDKRDAGRPPDDVARFGAKDASEAVLAYGLLRLAAVKRRSARAHADADRILDSAWEELPSEGGPYRGATELDGAPSPAANLGDQIRAAAAERTAHAHAVRAAHAANAKPRWFARPRIQLAMLVLATPFVFGAIAMGARASLAPLAVTPAQLQSIHPPTGRMVRVTCDRLVDGVWEVMSGDSVDRRVALCAIGKHVLPVVSDADARLPADVSSYEIEGELRDVPGLGEPHPSQPWVDALRKESDLNARAYDVYVYRDPAGRRVSIAIALALGAAVVAGWVFWVRAWRRRRAAAAV